MIAAFTYCKMEFKRALRIFPVFMAGAVVLAVLLGTIALLAGKVLYGEAALGRVETGVVLPENDKVAKQALKMLGSMDSVESICDFLYMDEEEGRKKLESGELSALLIVPENFVHSIMNGTNMAVTVVLPENPGIEARIFREMTEAGVRTLKTAQAAIYAADEWLAESEKRDKIPQAESDLNSLYLKYALNREVYFRDQKVSAAGNMTAGEHFAVCFFVMFLFLGGIPLSGFFRQEKRVFYQKLKMAGIGDGICAGAETAAVSFIYLASLAALAIVTSFLWPDAGNIMKEITWTGAAGAISCVIAAAAIITAVYEFCGNRMTGMIVLFWGSIVMLFLSGGILPSAFLPEGLRKAGAVMPSAYMITGIEKAVFSGWSMADTGRMAGIIFAFWGMAGLGRRIHG